MGCGNRARPSLWAPGRGSGAGGGWALQTGVGGGNGARFCSHSWKHPRQLVAMPGLPADLTTTTWSVRRAKTDRYLFRLSRREPVWGEILVRSPLHPAAININLSVRESTAGQPLVLQVPTERPAYAARMSLGPYPGRWTTRGLRPLLGTRHQGVRSSADALRGSIS